MDNASDTGSAGSVLSGGQRRRERRAWPELAGRGAVGGAGDGTGEPRVKSPTPSSTIESVASNFMLHVEQVERENNELLADNRRLVSKLKEADDQHREVVDANNLLRTELAELTKQHQEIKDENSTLLLRLARSKREEQEQLGQRDRKCEELKNKVKALQDDQRVLDKDKAELKAQVKGGEEKVAALETEVGNLCDQLADAKRRTDEMARQKTTIDRNEVETRNIKEFAASLEDERNYLAGEIRKLKAEIKEKDYKIVDVTRRNSDLSHLNKLESAKTEQTKTELEKLRKALKDKEREVEKLKTAKKDVQDERASSRRELQDLRKQVSDLKQQLFEIEQENEELRTETERRDKSRIHDSKLLEDSKKAIDKVTTKLGDLKLLLRSKEEHISDLRKEVDMLKKANSSIQRELDRERVTVKESPVMKEKYEEVSNKHKKLLEENIRLRAMVASRAIDEANASSELCELRLKLDESERKQDSSSIRIRQLEKWMDEIYKDPDLDVVLKSDTARRSVMSLPEVPTTGQSSFRSGYNNRASPWSYSKKSRTDRRVVRLNPRSIQALSEMN